MRNVKEKDVEWGVGRMRSEGASVNAEHSSLKLPYTAADPVPELVWSTHTGLTLKSANSGAHLRKPLLLWNVGPAPAGGDHEYGDGDHHHIIIDPHNHKELAPEASSGGRSGGWDEDKSGCGMKRKQQIDGSPNFVACANDENSQCRLKTDDSNKISPQHPVDHHLASDAFGAKEEMKRKGKEIVEETMIGSKAMACVFARNIKQRCFFCGGCHHVRHCPSVTKSKSQVVEKNKRSTSPTKQLNIDQEMMFDAIRNLRLSRADILRWMNWEGGRPISHLKGFFVRLRLRMGNEEATCYYVACITGDDHVTENKCMWVDVGGIKSCVATQYVSNHHFLQDEIKAWLSRTLRSGCTIPSLAHLNSKFNHRQTFGF